MSLRVLVVDDEASARRRMLALLNEIDGAGVVGEAADAAQALVLARNLQPDLILLDIDMPGASGLDLAATLEGGEARPAIVFVTAFDNFAVEAFGVAATDYLLKPVPLDRLRSALDRVRARRAARQAEGRLVEMAEVVATLRAAHRRSAASEAFWVQRRGVKQRVAVADVMLIEAEHDHVRLHTPGGTHLLRDRIGRLESELDPLTFLRIHRSAIVRRSAIREVRQSPSGAYTLVLDGGRGVPVGRKYAAVIRSIARSG